MNCPSCKNCGTCTADVTMTVEDMSGGQHKKFIMKRHQGQYCSCTGLCGCETYEETNIGSCSGGTISMNKKIFSYEEGLGWKELSCYGVVSSTNLVISCGKVAPEKYRKA